MTAWKVRRCRECGVGQVKLLAKPGRVTRYKTLPALPVPATLEIPTCDSCGAEWLNDELAQKLDEALEEAYRKELHQRALAALEVLVRAVPQKRLEELLGLSQGYLSKLRSGERIPSAELVGHLALLAHEPELRVRELELFWENPSPALPG